MFDDFFVRALVAGIGVAIVTGPLGCFVIWRRLAYFGDTLSHSALLGVTLAFSFSINISLSVFFVSGIIALLLLSLQKRTKLPGDALLGGEEGKFQALMETLIAARISHAIKSVGLATAAFEYALAYSKEREAFGRSINKFQAISFKLSQMAVKIETARLLGYKAAWLYDQGKPCVKEASMAKLYSAEIVQWCASEGIQVLGGYGYATEYEAERFYRDAKLSSITEGTSEIQHVIIAKELGI